VTSRGLTFVLGSPVCQVAKRALKLGFTWYPTARCQPSIGSSQ